MNKQIISLMCIAVLLALALVLANEKWPDGYRTAPQVSVDTASVGAVVKGAVTLPEPEVPAQKDALAEQGAKDSQSGTEQVGSGETLIAEGQNAEKTAPQGELVAIDNGTLRNDVPPANTVNTTAKKSDSTETAGKTPEKASEKTTGKAPDKGKQASSSEKKPTQASEKPKENTTKKANNSVVGKATPKILLYTQEAVLEITANGPIRCKTFKLTSPDRLVVDLIGKWDVPVPTVPSNTIIQRVRVGEASEKTRIVLDLKRPLKSDKIVQVNATTINVRMQ